MAFPIIGYRSMLGLSTTTITDPGTETGFSIASLHDMKSYTLWKSDQTASAVNIDIDAGAGGENADYIALVNHNLNTLGATVRVLADTVDPPLVEVLAAVTPDEDTVTYISFTAPGAKRYWRITINHAALPFSDKPNIGDCYMGMKTTMPEFLTSDFSPFFTAYEVAGARSEGGHALSATIRGQVHRATMEFGGPAGVARSFHDSDLTTFASTHAMRRHPFFFVLDADDATFDRAFFIKMTDTGDLMREAVGGGWSGRLTFTMPVEEAYMEPPE